MIHTGDRFRVTRTVDPRHVLIVPKAPAHTQSTYGRLPAGTVIVASDLQPEATAFVARPEDYAALESELVPADVRAEPSYFAYYLAFNVSDIGDLLEPLG
jgi:hypothetical protein